MKYHCTKRPYEDLVLEDKMLRMLKVVNLGIPCLAYGVGAWFLISEKETIVTDLNSVTIYFLYPEDKAAKF